MGDTLVMSVARVLGKAASRRRIVAALAACVALPSANLAATSGHHRHKQRRRMPQAVRTESSPAVERELHCSDGTTFIGHQVRQGATPASWRNVDPDAFPTAFTFFAVTVTDPDGTVVEQWDHAQGVTQHQDLVTCSFIIPVGPFIGDRVDFLGFFEPAGHPR